MTSTPSSLVLGCAYGLPAASLRPFACSLRATGYRGQIGLVLGHYGADELSAVESLADIVIKTDDEYESVNTTLLKTLRAVRVPFDRRGFAYPALFRTAVRLTRGRRSVRAYERSIEYNLEGLMALRHGHYHRIVAAREDVDQVLITDVRDVFFQRDPFEPCVAGLEVYLEPSKHTIGREPFNTAMIRRLYGRRTLAALAGEVASCAGTVIGPRQQIVRYLYEMSHEITRHRCPIGAYDQGVHNYLLRLGRLGHATMVRNGTGRVLTMNGMTRFARAADGAIMNCDGSLPAVLHQYDRFPDLWRELSARFG